MKAQDLESLEQSLLKQETTPFWNTADEIVHTCSSTSIRLETELPEELYKEMMGFIGSNPNWDQYSLFNSALANFLFRNGAKDRGIRETFLNDLFSQSDLKIFRD